MAIFESGHQTGQWVVKWVENQSNLMKKSTINDMLFSWADGCCFPVKNDTSFLVAKNFKKKKNAMNFFQIFFLEFKWAFLAVFGKISIF